MVHAYHAIFAAYGFWLPNDPRGSWSDFVRRWELLRFGPATKVTTRQSLAAKPHDFALRQQAKQALMYPEVRFTGVQAREIGRAFEGFVQKSGLVVWACSILPEHVHLVIARHRYKIEQLVNLLKGAATTRLMEQGLHPLAEYARDGERPPPMWVRGKWKVFLDCEEDIIRAIRYVEQNPIKEGKPAQRWRFVTRFEGLSV
jgi:REP element-mobilizing transposase RayT